MSYHQLQRVVVRMLYDPDFVAQIFADPATALRDEDLTDQERRWLVEVDRRAYAVDPLRRARTLTALIEEFPVSVQHLVQQTGQPALLDAFFSSPHFHTCIQQRGSLAASFSAYVLSEGAPAPLPDLALSPWYTLRPLWRVSGASRAASPARLRRSMTASCWLHGGPQACTCWDIRPLSSGARCPEQ